MEASELLKERRQLFDDTIAFKHTNRVPLLSNFWTWKVFDAGYTLDQALYDYDILEKCMRQFIERYQFDAYGYMGTRNALRITRALGSQRYQIDENGEALIVHDKAILMRDEYDELVAGIRNGTAAPFFWEKVFPRICREGITAAELVNGVKEMLAFSQYSAKMKNVYANEYGVLRVSGGAGGFAPFEELFSDLRGIKEASLDLRKCRSKVKDYCDAYWDTQIPLIEREAAQPKNVESFTDHTVVFISHSVLNRKQFEELYWPYTKKVFDEAHKNGKTVYVLCEASALRFAEFLEEIPKGVALFQLEQDDVFEFRKRLPNIAIAGGMSADMLGNGTVEECIDHAKHLVDELGEGYVFSTDKMMSYRKDAKRENVLAVNEFLRNYSL